MHAAIVIGPSADEPDERDGARCESRVRAVAPIGTARRAPAPAASHGLSKSAGLPAGRMAPPKRPAADLTGSARRDSRCGSSVALTRQADAVAMRDEFRKQIADHTSVR